jgi:Viral BACON domain
MKRLAWPPLVALAFMAMTLLLGCGLGGGGGAQPPILSVAQSNVLFNGAFGGSNPAPISVNVTNTGGGTLTFSASSDSPWLSVTPGNGSAPQIL